MPNIRVVSDSLLEEGMACERMSMDKTFDMKKGEALSMPDNLNKVFVGLGWTCNSNVDLDASCIMINSSDVILDTVYYSHKNAPGVNHGGDNTTGEGKGYDEVIKVDLSKLNNDVYKLVFVVNIFSSNTFKDVKDS